MDDSWRIGSEDGMEIRHILVTLETKNDKASKSMLLEDIVGAVPTDGLSFPSAIIALELIEMKLCDTRCLFGDYICPKPETFNVVERRRLAFFHFPVSLVHHPPILTNWPR